MFNIVLPSLCRVYLLGHDVCLDKLYPKVSFPVSRGTPMIGPVVKLRDANKLDIVAKIARSIGLKSVCKVVITSRSKEWRYITGHVIDGKFHLKISYKKRIYDLDGINVVFRS